MSDADGSLIESLVRDAERAEAALAEEECARPPAPRRARRATPTPAPEAPLASPAVETGAVACLRGRLPTAEAQRAYILAPRAGGSGTFTLVSEKTGARYTYKVSAPKAETGAVCRKCEGTGTWRGGRGGKGPCFACKGTGGGVEKGALPEILFVKLLTGSDNENSYSYLGNLRLAPHPRYEHGRKSAIGEDAPGAKAIGWYLAKLLGNAPTHGVEVWHEGRCGRCGLKLTVPESVARGIGPDCAEKMGL